MPTCLQHRCAFTSELDFYDTSVILIISVMFLSRAALRNTLKLVALIIFGFSLPTHFSEPISQTETWWRKQNGDGLAA